MDVRPALLHEQPAIRSLLTAAELPLEDLATADVRFLVATQDDEPVAAIGLESFEGAGLLRSLVVRADLRGSGIGGQLVDALESLARESGMDRLVLLTQTAAPFFQRRGDEVEALSAGSKPSGQINPKAVRFMSELGYDLTRHASKSLDDIGGEFDAVITMGCGDDCPWVPARRREDWGLPDPKHMDDEGYRAVRDDISARVKALLASL